MLKSLEQTGRLCLHLTRFRVPIANNESLISTDIYGGLYVDLAHFHSNKQSLSDREPRRYKRGFIIGRLSILDCNDPGFVSDFERR